MNTLGFCVHDAGMGSSIN